MRVTRGVGCPVDGGGGASGATLSHRGNTPGPAKTGAAAMSSTTTSTPTTPTAKTSSTGRTALIAVGGAVAGAAVVAGLVFGLGGFGSSTTTGGAAPAVVPAGTVHHHVTPVTPLAPSQA